MATSAQDRDLTLYDYLEIVYRRRWTVAAVAAGVFGALAFYAFYATPIYRASTLLDLEKEGDLVREQRYEGPDDDYLATQSKLIVSDSALRRAYKALKLGKTKEYAAGIQPLRDSVSVLAVPRTRLVYVNAESTNPQLAVVISSALAHDFVSQNLNNQLFMPKNVLAQLEKRASGADARRFRESLPPVIASPVIQQLKERITQAESELAGLSAKYTDTYPDVVARKSELSILRAAKDQEVDRIVRGFWTELSGQFRPNNVRIVDPAQLPRKPVRPRRPLALLIGAAGGLILGVLAALGLETFDQTVRTHGDVERRLGLPLLGHIPLARMRRKESVYAPLLSSEPSMPAEAFRNLRTMVLFSKASDNDPFLLVTSAVQQEGKSFVAANLAVALSQLGKNVLLVDGDLRSPAQDRIFSTVTHAGLSDFLSGRVHDPADVGQETDVPNLTLASCGKRPPNPAELLSSQRLGEFVSWARGRYDRVVVDCPPVFPVSDVLLWGRHVRSSLLIARSGRTRVPLIETACARLRSGGIDILGGVINGTRPATMTRADGAYFDRSYRRFALDHDASEPA